MFQGAADQRCRLHREVRWPDLERAQRRKVVAEAADDELREPLRPRQVLEPVLAEIAQRDALGQVSLDEVTRRLRNYDLAVVAGRSDARRERDVESDVARR